MIALNNVKRENCIYIGDRPSDIQASVDANFGYALQIIKDKTKEKPFQINNTLCIKSERSNLFEHVKWITTRIGKGIK